MEKGTLISMIIILSLVWGGFISFLMFAMRKNVEKLRNEKD